MSDPIRPGIHPSNAQPFDAGLEVKKEKLGEPTGTEQEPRQIPLEQTEERPLDDLDALMGDMFATASEFTTEIETRDITIAASHEITLIQGHLATESLEQATNTAEKATETSEQATSTSETATETTAAAAETTQEAQTEETFATVKQQATATTKGTISAKVNLMDELINLKGDSKFDIVELLRKTYEVLLTTGLQPAEPAKASFKSCKDLGIEEVKKKGAQLAFPDFKNKKLMVEKELAAKLPPQVEITNEETGEKVLLDVVAMDKEQVTKLLETFDRCIVTQTRLNQMSALPTPEHKEEAPGETMSIRQLLEMNQRPGVEERRKEPAHERIREKQEIPQKAFEVGVPSLFTVQCQVVKQRMARKKEEEKVQEAARDIKRRILRKGS